MPSSNNRPPEFFIGAQNPSLHDSILSNTSGHLISVNVANHFTPGLARLSSENQDLQSAFGQMMEEYPVMPVYRPPAPWKSNNPFALNRNNLNLEVETRGTSCLIFSL